MNAARKFGRMGRRAEILHHTFVDVVATVDLPDIFDCLTKIAGDDENLQICV